MNSRRLLGGIALMVIAVGLQVQPWVLTLGIIFLSWKAAIEFFGLAKPSRWLTNILTVVFLGLVLTKYHTVLTQEASSSFLVLLTSLKLLEERTLRDQKFLLLLGCILLSSLFLFTLELPYLSVGAVSFYLLWSAQNSFLRYGSHFLKALPYVAFLFLFFPRVQNPFGLQGQGAADVANTGFGDDLNPGSISRIQESSELAFRVQFFKRGNLLTRDQYWRGQVLQNADGLHWTRKRTPAEAQDRHPLSAADYEVTLEPQAHRWLFVWDPTAKLTSKEIPLFARINGAFETYSDVRERVSYEGEIAPSPPTISQTGRSDLSSDLQTAPVSRRVRELAESFAPTGATRTAITDAILQYFRQHDFHYSRNPGLASGTIDGFLFTTRKGYCEHYAAVLATLLRLVKIPARVVTGYQGGQYNAYGKFWRFTQADAHAWVEFLDEQNIWQRVDPTNAVAPERTELGGQLFADLPEAWIGQNKASEFLHSREAWWMHARTFISDGIESLNYEVILFLLDFNIERQKDLAREYGAWLVLAAALMFLPFLAHSYRKRRRPTTAEWLLRELQDRARSQGVVREPAETVRSFTARWRQANPEQKQVLDQLLNYYEAFEYGTSQPLAVRKDLRALLRALGRNNNRN
jgi:transglutaminase-like putative cysteine protease